MKEITTKGISVVEIDAKEIAGQEEIAMNEVILGQAMKAFVEQKLISVGKHLKNNSEEEKKKRRGGKKKKGNDHDCRI